MSSPKATTNPVLNELQQLLPKARFVAGDSFYWSPKTQTISYCATSLDNQTAVWSLLHEASHAVLRHTTYNSDLELLLLEVAAWRSAVNLGRDLGITVDEDHLQDCLDTYRDWLHQRSTCPACGIVCFQKDARTYSCFNCNKRWHVSASRFCRPYRLSADTMQNKKSPEAKPRTTFQ